MRITFEASPAPARTIEIHGGLTLMEAAVRSGIEEIEAECGGACACATCHVYVAPEWLSVTGPPSAMEAELLDMVDDRRPSSRLSCQIALTEALDGLVVALPGGRAA